MAVTVTAPEFERLVRRGHVQLLRPDALSGERTAVRARGTSTIVRATVTAQIRIDLSEVDDELAGELGFGSAGELRRWWRERWCGVHPPASERPFPTATPAWVVSLQHDPIEPPRLLGRGRNIRDLGYVTHPARALPGEPEAVPPDYQQLLTERAQRLHEARARRSITELARTISKSAAEIDRLAPQAGASDLRPQTRAITKLARDIERKTCEQGGNNVHIDGARTALYQLAGLSPKNVRAYEPRQPEHMLAIDLLVQWLEDRGGTATRRDLLRAHVAGVRTAKDLDALLERYESIYPGCVTREIPPGGGRRVVITSPRYIQRDAESGRDTVDKHPNRRPSRDRTRGAHIGALP